MNVWKMCLVIRPKEVGGMERSLPDCEGSVGLKIKDLPCGAFNKAELQTDLEL